MNNWERFEKAINWEPVDRIQTYDLADCEPMLAQLGGYDQSKSILGKKSWN